ncbi:MAG: 4'-phosphopantetheinyl transferase superfamily protein [Paramuribaculum sp.]|nr:4'-phosphopantetheinyl transferase superfamily protein [Paramuribaculum sp.]
MTYKKDLPVHFVTANAEIYTAAVDYSGKHSRLEAERTAVAHLIRTIFGPEASCGHHADGAPYVIGRLKTSVSISHCNGCAAVAVSPDGNPVGIDIELPRPQLRRIAPRFLTPAEQELYGASDLQLLKVWTAKEATFKCARMAQLVVSKISVDLETETATIPDGRKFRLVFMEGYTQMAAISTGLSD